jgi:hypothetical protein
VQRLPQRQARMLGIELWPEQRQQTVATAEAAGCGEGEVDEEREPLGLRQQGAQLAVCVVAQIDPTEHAKPIHVDRSQREGR